MLHHGRSDLNDASNHDALLWRKIPVSHSVILHEWRIQTDATRLTENPARRPFTTRS